MHRGEVWWVDFDERRPVLLLGDEEPSGFRAIQVVAAAPTDITGVALEQPFFKDALAKLDIDPEFSKRSAYKTAPETFTERGFTPAAREMMESLANDLTMVIEALKHENE